MQTRLSGKSSLKGSFRELPVGARHQRIFRGNTFRKRCAELAVGTTGATVTSLRLFKPSKDASVRKNQNRVVPREFTPLFIRGVFLLVVPCPAAKSMRRILRGIREAEW